MIGHLTVCCPRHPAPGAIGHQIIGCGHVFDALPDDDGLIDCPECGIWFPASEPGVLVGKQEPSQ